jgi:N-methylhydantoinase A
LSIRGRNYRLGFDTGGTFTDFALFDESTGSLHVHKVLSTPQDPALAVIKGVRDLVERLDIDPGRDHLTIYGATTVVTNAAIERKGAQTALLVTEGFRDVLEFRREQRYDIYNLFMTLPEPVVPRRLVYGIRERMNAEGQEVLALDPDSLEEAIARMREEQVRSVAVCFLHSYINGAHEAQVVRRLEAALPDVDVTLSSELVPEMREFERASTTTLNAYTRPLLREHTQNLRRQLKALGFKDDFYLMLSSGGILSSELASKIPVKAIESGPAAGALASTYYSASMGRPNILSFDMGGTTAKVCVISEGQPSVTNQFEVARVARFERGSGLPVRIPVINMIEIGTGGGSIARVDHLGLIQVGPRSAGAEPGPSCYGQGGTTATVTDADLVLGYLNPDYFLGGAMKLDLAAATRAIQETIAVPSAISLEDAAWGIHAIANQSMVRAAAVHVVEQAKDPRNFTMIAFGGAGPLHACRVARSLGIGTVVCPYGAGVTSAVGLLVAPLVIDFGFTRRVPLSNLDWTRVSAVYAEHEATGRQQLIQAGADPAMIAVTRTCDMRYVGQGYEISVPFPGSAGEDTIAEVLMAAFNNEYRALFGREIPGVPVEVLNWRGAVRADSPALTLRSATSLGSHGLHAAMRGTRKVYLPEQHGYVEVPVYNHDLLPSGAEFRGPAIVEQKESTTVVIPGSHARVDDQLNLIIQFD